MASKSGKLVKKSDEKMMSLLDMDSYPWLHFNEQSIIFPDNVKRSVILEKMHDPLEITQKVISAKEFEKPFAGKSKPLIPRDMTEDYKRGQREALKRRRRTLMDEEEAMALELAELEHVEEVKLGKEKQKDKEKKINKKEDNKFDPNLSEKKDMALGESENKLKVFPKENITEEKKEVQPPLLQEDKVKENVDPKILELELNKAKEDGFQEGRKEGFEQGEKIGKEEGYKVGIDEGNRMGFQVGEEKGLVAVESKYDKAFANISEAALKMDELKTTLISEGKEIFLEILKLCSEKIIREQIKASDTTLFRIFDDVIKEIDTNSNLTIQVNSHDAQRLKKHLEVQNSKYKIKIKENNSLENGNFQVENEAGASLVDIRKNVDTIIDNIKDELFKEISSNKEANYDIPKKAG
ncbi:FliH/SctL family protein [Pigmentibacter sp. JX0631]|uniref:FliH/SctL family protein n=1 Tax=Pigmentibacter sp. JX0631 TaxID=2976982 RepID=UPI00246915AF|nr:FliH/SctL family protein [Pigmentibacter sp. JX0631]WGL59453.1 FliH/SctL family protein [Pigmentibacter sp. JX0631]